MAMELKGDGIWGDGVNRFDEGFYLRFARLVEAVRSLHDKGFVHADLSETNVRIQRDDPNFISLDGFTFARVFSTEEPGGLFNRRTDMKDVGGILLLIPTSTPIWVFEFRREMASLAVDARPDYEKWITFSRTQAEKMR